ncbi:MAG: type II toxin-antitoxin system RelE/ParE family toxin [Alphaproteobacteria bacterium]|nr:type II toxin-antitoxin system RelE/ParE family toxin [Alphaproteobacteria bacterium]
MEAIWDYVFAESGNADIADRVIGSITRRIYVLARFPNAGRPRDDELGVGRRSLPARDYVIVYRLDGNDVLVLRVVHGRRDIKALFGF